MIRHFSRTDLLLMLCSSLWATQGWSSGLNDSGQLQCYDAKGKVIDCTQSPDDGRYGRDVAASTGRLDKVGQGKSGFDFTKIANNGTELPFSAKLGNEPGDWACTRDNVTGLFWEVKTAAQNDLRHGGHRYHWYSSDPAINGGDSGTRGDPVFDTCKATLPDSLCNTQAYVAAINASNLCGLSDWRLPVLPELQSLVDYGAKQAPTIDVDFFPNTAANWYWVQNVKTSSPTSEVWNVHFGKALSGVGNKDMQYPIRLVRKAK
ncbi:MAG: DUF1566 domain-containing protein [Gammaproteobacteria bacterium]|nr:DUF1566 domain-containing protein [Gammaproteobacteria bacterium]